MTGRSGIATTTTRTRRSAAGSPTYAACSAADLDARAAEGRRTLRLLSLCAGDGRDTIPVLAARRDLEVDAVLVELDAGLAEAARTSAAAVDVSVDVRTADAGSFESFRDRLMNDVLLLCGIFGNISDADVERCVQASCALVRPGGTVIWTRGSRLPDDPSDQAGDPAEWVRGLFAAAGFEEVAFVVPVGCDVPDRRRSAGGTRPRVGTAVGLHVRQLTALG